MFYKVVNIQEKIEMSLERSVQGMMVAYMFLLMPKRKTRNYYYKKLLHEKCAWEKEKFSNVDSAI